MLSNRWRKNGKDFRVPGWNQTHAYTLRSFQVFCQPLPSNFLLTVSKYGIYKLFNTTIIRLKLCQPCFFVISRSPNNVRRLGLGYVWDPMFKVTMFKVPPILHCIIFFYGWIEHCSFLLHLNFIVEPAVLVGCSQEIQLSRSFCSSTQRGALDICTGQESQRSYSYFTYKCTFYRFCSTISTDHYL